uniref:Mitochondrial inner membrane protease subunit 2 n=1 Tax=Chenopodium quinoa TaxID=63459 RepID=A0A803LF87_CHEQI
MVSVSTWCRYIAHKLEYSMAVSWKNYKGGRITEGQIGDTVWKNLFQGKIFKCLFYHDSRVFIGDVVVLKDPESPKDYLVRRLAATEGYEMVSKDEKEEPFILDKDECWVLADNEALKPKEAKDSRTFGPVHMSDIIGRVIYCLRNAVDHGPVRNSEFSVKKDLPVLEVELDVEEMAKNHKT